MIGGGLFGCTAAIHAQRAGYEVHLYERDRNLMHAASFGSYMRLHRGYHYPRSPDTGKESLRAEASFRQEYGAAVIDGGRQLYAVADGGHISGDGFAWFMDSMNLPYVRECNTDLVTCDWLFDVQEPRLDYEALAALVRQKLTGVVQHLGEAMPADAREQFDAIIVAAYAGTNGVLRGLGLAPERFKYQVVEKPFVRMPDGFRNTSIVVLDGPFGCLDPHGSSDMHVLGHVVETVHETVTGTVPPEGRPESRFEIVRDELAKLIPAVRDAKYVGSVFSVRALLPDQEKTDARPTLVQRMDEQVIRIFSGKMGTAVTAARDAVAMLRRMEGKLAA